MLVLGLSLISRLAEVRQAAVLTAWRRPADFATLFSFSCAKPLGPYYCKWWTAHCSEKELAVE